MRSWLLVLMVTLSLLPSMEVVEAAMHLVEHGDLAHDEHDRSAGSFGSDEHGCSGALHFCGHTASMIPASAHLVPQPFEFPPTTATQLPLDSSRGRGPLAPPIRPPIA